MKIPNGLGTPGRALAGPAEQKTAASLVERCSQAVPSEESEQRVQRRKTSIGGLQMLAFACNFAKS